MAEFAAREHVGHPALWELQRAEMMGRLAAVIEADGGSQPLEMERRFGFEGSWPALRFVSGDDEVHVRGAIDRIDRASDGTLVVLDYKSGRPESLRRKLRGETLLAPEFQLSLYAAVLLQREPGVRVDAAYLSLQTGERTATLRKAAAKDGVDIDALLGSALPRAVFERVGEMRRGFFEVRPLSCDYCDLKPACRLVALPTDPDENGGQVSRG
jgi:RecB family exonuclease